MAPFEESLRLFAKADEDHYVLLKLLNDPQAPDSIIGFHAQQMAEKLLKAALFTIGMAPPRTHQLALLIDLLSDHGQQLPDDSEELRALTPFAVLYRYDDVETVDEEPLDRLRVAAQLDGLRGWVASIIKGDE